MFLGMKDSSEDCWERMGEKDCMLLIFLEKIAPLVFLMRLWLLPYQRNSGTQDDDCHSLPGALVFSVISLSGSGADL